MSSADPCRDPRELRAVPSPIGAKEVLEVLQSTGLAPSLRSEHDPRWERLRFRKMPDVGRRDRILGALIGRAIGDAMGRPNEGLRRARPGSGGSGTTRPGMAGGAARRGQSPTTPR